MLDINSVAQNNSKKINKRKTITQNTNFTWFTRNEYNYLLNISTITSKLKFELYFTNNDSTTWQHMVPV